jgi:alpha-amylase
MTDRFAKTDGSTDAACDVYKHCGGSWTGIIDKLDYIQSLGFGAIQISPVVQNIPNDTGYGEAYHGYWPQDLYALNDHFGSSTDLHNLVDAVHKRGMCLMVDVVINNMAQAISGTMADQPPPTIYWSELIPFNDQKYYHPYCNITNWSNPTAYQNCWLGAEVVALPDLDTESAAVTHMIRDWVRGLLSNHSFDAVRIDAAKHVNDAYLANFSQAAGVYSLGEVYSGDPDLVCRYQNAGLVPGLLNYPLYFPMIQAFTAGDMPALATMVDTVHSGCKDFTLLVTFLENQDLPRFASMVNDTAVG